jgi:hypothetical protein
MIWIIALLASLARKPVYIPETNGGSKITSANITHYNPWISIWFLPRATIRQIVSTKPDEHVTFLAIMFGIYTVLNFFYGQNFSIDLILQLAISVAIGGVLGYVAVRVFSKMLHWRGQRSGGRAKPDEVRAAVAWSTVPSLFLLLVLIPAIILNSRFATIDRTSFIVILFLISLVLLLWRAIILINCIAEINHLSLWEGLKIVFILWPFVLMVLGNLPINIP